MRGVASHAIQSSLKVTSNENTRNSVRILLEHNESDYLEETTQTLQDLSSDSDTDEDSNSSRNFLFILFTSVH